jgi:hypothetical protein
MFERRAATLVDAVFQVLYELKEIGLAPKVLCVDPCDLVSQIQISKRLDKTRQQIHQYICGQRGPGNFPKPIRYIEERKPVWSWSGVLRWFLDGKLLGVDSGSVGSAKDIGMINGFLANLHNRSIDRARFSKIEDRFHDLVWHETGFSARIPWDLSGPVDLSPNRGDGAAEANGYTWAVGA